MQEEESFTDTLKTILYAVIIAVLIRTFLFEPFKNVKIFSYQASFGPGAKVC